MPDFIAGQNVQAADLRSYVPIVAVASSDIVIALQDLMVDAPGMLLPLEAFKAYQFDGYIAYDAVATLEIEFTVPREASGSWTTIVEEPASNGEERYGRRTSFGSGNRARLPTASLQASTLFGFVTTGSFTGPLQMQFRQPISAAGITAIRAGSWLRASRIG